VVDIRVFLVGLAHDASYVAGTGQGHIYVPGGCIKDGFSFFDFPDYFSEIGIDDFYGIQVIFMLIYGNGAIFETAHFMELVIVNRIPDHLHFRAIPDVFQ
jgi:hypothetical protein